MVYQGHPGVNALASVLSQRMKKENESPLVLDFGSIGADYSLKVNTFPIPIPKKDYMVCRHVSGLILEEIGGKHSGHVSGAGEHIHNIEVPIIKPGDRVLVAWVQNDAVVIDVIVPANMIGGG